MSNKNRISYYISESINLKALNEWAIRKGFQSINDFARVCLFEKMNKYYLNELSDILNNGTKQQ